MQKNKFLALYGPMFVGAYILSFIFLVTFYGKFHFPTLPGDIKIGSSFYIPIVSAGGVAAFVVAFFEMFRFMKRF